jgi:hypothetical protein
MGARLLKNLHSEFWVPISGQNLIVVKLPLSRFDRRVGTLAAHLGRESGCKKKDAEEREGDAHGARTLCPDLDITPKNPFGVRFLKFPHLFHYP